MKIKRFCFISLTLVAGLGITACQRVTTSRRTFGQLDPTVDGVTLSTIEGNKDDAGGNEDDADSYNDVPVRTSRELDPDDLPKDLAMMVPLCDSINMACVENQKVYSAIDSTLIWHCVHMFAVTCDDKDYGIERVGDYYEVDPKVVDDAIYAMFGKLRSIPEMPSRLYESISEDDHPHIQISNELKYRFYAEDRGLTAPEVRSVTEYSDGSAEMTVALVDSETGEEIVSFLYTMRANTRDTTTSARYAYEITGARPADVITDDKMSGTPFLVPVIQTYGYDQYPNEDVKHNEVSEIMEYRSFKLRVSGMDELNTRISNEVLAFSNTETDDHSWHEIISYPVTTDDYVEVATTCMTYPSNGQDPDIYCYNYDKKNRKEMQKNDAFPLADVTSAQIEDTIRNTYDTGTPGDITGTEYKGFIVRNDGSVDLYYMVGISDKKSNYHRHLVVYNNVSESVNRAFGRNGLLSGIEEDVFKPPLTHGKKDN